MSVDTSNATATAGVDPSRARIAGAIKQAASTTGTSFEYLLATAKMESDFNPKAGASTSSAHGLYQFIDQTWLGTVKEAGAPARLRQIRRRHHQILLRQLFGQRSRRADGDHEAARRSGRRFVDGGRPDPVQQFQAHRQDRPPPDRRRTLYGALHGRRRRRQADLQCRGQSAGLRRRGCFPTPPRPTARSSSITPAARAASPKSIRC